MHGDLATLFLLDFRQPLTWSIVRFFLIQRLPTSFDAEDALLEWFRSVLLAGLGLFVVDPLVRQTSKTPIWKCPQIFSHILMVYLPFWMTALVYEATELWYFHPTLLSRKCKKFNFLNLVMFAFNINILWNMLHVQPGGTSALLMDLAASEKSVHADFLNGMIFKIYIFYLCTVCFSHFNH